MLEFHVDPCDDGAEGVKVLAYSVKLVDYLALKARGELVIQIVEAVRLRNVALVG